MVLVSKFRSFTITRKDSIVLQKSVKIKFWHKCFKLNILEWMDSSRLETTVRTSKLFILLGIFEQATRSWSMLGKLKTWSLCYKIMFCKWWFAFVFGSWWFTDLRLNHTQITCVYFFSFFSFFFFFVADFSPCLYFFS